MKVVNHPYLEGVLCRSDGAIFIPANGGNKAHSTFGYRRRDGYREVRIARKLYLVHRLMAETFLQCPIPDGMQIDHIDRDRSDNSVDNLRIVTPSENCRNKSGCVKGMESVVSPAVDKNAYRRALYANSSKYREGQKARQRAYQARKRTETALQTPQI